MEGWFLICTLGNVNGLTLRNAGHVKAAVEIAYTEIPTPPYKLIFPISKLNLALVYSCVFVRILQIKYNNMTVNIFTSEVKHK